jgi:hypothetical protein
MVFGKASRVPRAVRTGISTFLLSLLSRCHFKDATTQKTIGLFQKSYGFFQKSYGFFQKGIGFPEKGTAFPEKGIGLPETVITLTIQANNVMNTMETKPRAYGRTELAQAYFPQICSRAAWAKLKAVMADDPSLSSLLQSRRRSFMPAEVERIYAALGCP